MKPRPCLSRKCKKLGQNEKNCTNNKAISFNSSYVLMKDSKDCVSAKYVGLPIYGAKKMTFGCLKPWSLKPRPEEDIGCLIVDALNT